MNPCRRCPPTGSLWNWKRSKNKVLRDKFRKGELLIMTLEQNRKRTSRKGFRIYKQELYADTIRRLVLEQLNLSLEYCRQANKDTDTAVHEIRKCSKRIRALYRLCRTAIGEETFRHGMEKYRVISQALAIPRLSAVYIETLKLLTAEKRISVAKSFLSELMLAFEQHHKTTIFLEVYKQEIMSKTENLLLEEITSPHDISFFNVDFKSITNGIARTYNQGKTSLEIAVHEPVTENFHTLRKRVKYLWNQCMVLRPIWPPAMGMTIHQLDLLAEKLGNEHDLAELELFLNTNKIKRKQVQQEHLLRLIGIKRRQLQQAIKPLAMRIYAEKTSAIVSRLIAYEKVYRGKLL
jgi:CHAD domain-containing protein